MYVSIANMVPTNCQCVRTHVRAGTVIFVRSGTEIFQKMCKLIFCEDMWRNFLA